MCRQVDSSAVVQELRQHVPDALHIEVLGFEFATAAQRAKYPDDSKVRPPPPSPVLFKPVVRSSQTTARFENH